MENKKKISPACASCDLNITERICLTDGGKGYKGCPTLTRKKVLEQANKAYENSDTYHFAHQASVQEADCYANRDEKPYIMQPTKTRIQETCEFALKMKYKKIGLAFCLGLSPEAKVIENILKAYGFEVTSICCKAGNSSKDLIGITDKDKIQRGTDEAMCNPIFQAKTLSFENVEFNILLGLCVGHDTLFLQTTDIPTTVLAVKDRVTGHNPLAPVYNSETYHMKLKFPNI